MSDKAFERLLGALALAAAIVRCLGLHPSGDYATDAGPALSAAAHRHAAAFFSHQPAMGPLSLYLRVPFVLIGHGLGDGATGLYRWGCLPCLLALVAVSLWLAHVALRRGGGRIAAAIVLALCVLNPLVGDALVWGHPEELLTAALALGALLAACERRAATAAVLAGLAVASKQWALLVVVPVVLMLERDRVRPVLTAAGVAAAASVPMLVANAGAFGRMLSYISHPQPVVTAFTWLYPFSPAGQVTLRNPFGDLRTFEAHQLLGVEAGLRPVVILLAIALVGLAWWRGGGRPRTQQLLVATGLALLLRCALDPGSQPYYHLTLVLVLLAWDVEAGRRLPVAGMVGAAAAFLVDRAWSYLSVPAVNGVYVAITVAGGAMLVRFIWEGAARARVLDRGLAQLREP